MYLECTNINERELNASINIIFEGIKEHMKEIKKCKSVKFWQKK